MRSLLSSLLALCIAACTTTPVATPDAAIPADDAALPDDAPNDAYVRPSPMVTIADGTIRGTQGTGFRAFLGIPYAAPPVGDRRLRPPAPVTPWTTPLVATRRPTACPQDLRGIAYGGEDCLYLNVHTPDPVPASAPVMVWIHGGAFVLGEGVQADNGTVGDILAREHGVIVVSMNYRLGQLGFLAHPALAAENGGHSGNYGFLDQVAALQWVHDNIAAFGGDPANVTIFGESAGGMSVCGHLTSTLSQGLFQRAILESGPCGLPMQTSTEADAQGMRFATSLGCTTGDVAACLRAADPGTIVHTLGSSPAIFSVDPMYASWGPTIDGHTFTASWIDAIEAGDAADVPIAVGWNQDEGRLFIALAEMAGDPPITDATYRSTVVGLVGEANADAVIARYPSSMFGGDARLAAARAMGDAGLACPARAAAIALRDAGNEVHTYFFRYPDAHFILGSSFPLGAFHSAEIQFVFGHSVGGAFDTEQMALHDAMSGYWTRFASQNGDPNATGTTTWPAYDTTGARIVFDATVTTGVDDYADTCAFWDTIPLPH
jgi:para-nitrobenzyl esterase